MTERLYYTDSSARDFDAAVVAIERRGGRVLVRLDCSAFYPTSGGQPFDTGTLGGVDVVDVFDEDEGVEVDVTHVLAGDESAGGSALRIGALVRGVVDWPRRFDHMQQHTGQHVLSAAFDRLFGARTISFRLGARSSTIDLDREMTPDEIVRSEGEANRIVWEDRPVAIRFATPEEASRLPLRKPPAKEGMLRLIEVEGFDLSACGGTHVARTGSIGLIAIASWERFKGGQRLEFVCGGRALTRFRSQRDQAAAVVRMLSVSSDEVPEAIARLQAETREINKTLASVRGELARYRADELAAAGEITSRGRLVAQALDADVVELKAIATAVAAHSGVTAILTSAATPALVVVARSRDGSVRANDILAALIAAFGGRGGGKPELAQGGGLAAPPARILAEARRLFLSAP